VSAPLGGLPASLGELSAALLATLSVLLAVLALAPLARLLASQLVASSLTLLALL